MADNSGRPEERREAAYTMYWSSVGVRFMFWQPTYILGALPRVSQAAAPGPSRQPARRGLDVFASLSALSFSSLPRCFRFESKPAVLPTPWLSFKSEKRKEVAAAKAAEMQEAAKVAMEGLETSRASTIEAKRKANLEADAAAKEFFASEANPWSKIVEYCDMKPKAQAKDAPKMKDTTRLRGMLLDLKHNPKE